MSSVTMLTYNLIVNAILGHGRGSWKLAMLLSYLLLEAYQLRVDFSHYLLHAQVGGILKRTVYWHWLLQIFSIDTTCFQIMKYFSRGLYSCFLCWLWAPLPYLVLRATFEIVYGLVAVDLLNTSKEKANLWWCIDTFKWLSNFTITYMIRHKNSVSCNFYIC